MAIITNTNSFFTNSKLYLKFGTTKTATSPWGDFVSFGSNRVIEGVVDLTQVTAGNTLIVSDVLFFPSLAAGQLFIEEIQAVTEVAATGGTTFDFGLVQSDRAIIPAGYGTAFISAQAIAGVNALGKKIVYTTGVASAGGLIGTAPAVQTPVAPNLAVGYYLTVSAVGTFTAGKIRLRVYYHALDVAITQ